MVYWCPETEIERMLKNFPIKLLTNYISQGPSWETDSRSSGEDFAVDRKLIVVTRAQTKSDF